MSIPCGIRCTFPAANPASTASRAIASEMATMAPVRRSRRFLRPAAARASERSNAEALRPQRAREPSSSPFNSGRSTRAQRVPATAILAGRARTRVPPFMSTSLSRASLLRQTEGARNHRELLAAAFAGRPDPVDGDAAVDLERKQVVARPSGDDLHAETESDETGGQRPRVLLTPTQHRMVRLRHQKDARFRHYRSSVFRT